MKPSPSLLRVLPVFLAVLIVPLQAGQDSTKTLQKPAAAAAQAKPTATQAAAPVDTIAKAEKPAAAAPAPRAENGNGVEKMRLEAARLKAEAKLLRDMADTLNRSSDEAEQKADEAKDKAEKMEDELRESDAQHMAAHVKVEIEKIKRIIQADVERLRKLHGYKTSNDSLYALQADSLDSVLTHLPADTNLSVEKQKMLVQEITDNSEQLLEKSREMSSKARELEEAADRREDLAEDLTGKADKLEEELNPLPLSKRFPFHLGFDLRLTDIRSPSEKQPDLLILHGFYATYSATPLLDFGLRDITLYTQQTVLGTRYAITGSPSVKIAFFPVKRLQLGAIAGVSLQGRVGCLKPAQMSAAPFVTAITEVWVRNHFSISPTLRLNYAAYGPYYTVALSDHSGVLPQGALWLDLGIGYNFNF